MNYLGTHPLEGGTLVASSDITSNTASVSLTGIFDPEVMYFIHVLDFRPNNNQRSLQYRWLDDSGAISFTNMQESGLYGGSGGAGSTGGVYSTNRTGGYTNFGRQDLEFGQIDARWRKPLGTNWNLTLGGSLRGHPAYGLFPFNDWLAGSNGQWWTLAYGYGYSDEYWFEDLNDNGIQDPGEFGSYEWYDEDGELIAETDDEFYEYYYGDIINLYNEEEVDKLGWQYEASFVIGLDYYLYDKKYWVHGWASILPISKGLTDYSFVYESGDIDFDIGLVAGYKFDKSFGVFGEARYLRYWSIDSYELKVGLNYTVF